MEIEVRQTILIFLFIFIIGFSVFGFVIANGECKDNDHGLNYSVKRSCRDDDGYYIDICVADRVIKEYYCVEESVNQTINETTNETVTIEVCDYETYWCPGICRDGKCVEEIVEEKIVQNESNVSDSEQNFSLNESLEISNESIENVTGNLSESEEDQEVSRNWFRRVINWFKGLYRRLVG